MRELIDKQAAINALKGLEFHQYMEFGEYIGEDTREVRLIRAEKAQDALQKLPTAQPEGWLEQNKDKILQAGMEGREVEFRIGGRLFAIREKAQ